MVQAYVCMNISEFPTPSLRVASGKVVNVHNLYLLALVLSPFKPAIP